MVRVWPHCWQAVGGHQDKIWDFVVLRGFVLIDIDSISINSSYVINGKLAAMYRNWVGFGPILPTLDRFLARL